jgi:flagellar motor switch protein FliM
MEVVLLRHDFRNKPPAPARADTLDELHAIFASRFSAALHETLSIPAEIAVRNSDVMRHADFLASRSNPTCLSVLRIDPTGAQICLELSPSIAFPLIDRLLGGHCELAQQTPSRPLTQIEQGLALQIIERAGAALADTWRGAGVESVREEAVFGDPAHARIMPDNEMVSVVTFGVTFKTFSGPVTLCLPAMVTDILTGASQSITPSAQSPADSRRDTQNLATNVMQSAVELRALLAETKLRLTDVLSLAEGDIITTEIPTDAAIPLRLQGQTVLKGRIAQLDGNRAIEIESPAPAGGQPKA